MAEFPVTAITRHEEVLTLKAPECSTICAGTGSKQNGYDLYMALIVMVLNFYGVNWKAEQIKECAEMIYDDFYFLTIAELKQFAQKVKSGHFATTHFNPSFLNPVTLIDWMGQYADESLKLRQQIAITQANEERYDERWGTYDEKKNENYKDQSMAGQIEIIKGKLKDNPQNQQRA